MNHLQSHHSVRDELGSESESYNQLSESLCKASTSWLGKRIWSINFNGVLGTFYIIYGILVARSFFIGYLLWTYFFWKNIVLVPPLPIPSFPQNADSIPFTLSVSLQF